jgi:hypothetical protein
MPAVTRPSDTSCGPNGTAPNVTNPLGYTCISGYYMAPAPEYCRGTYARPGISLPFHFAISMSEKMLGMFRIAACVPGMADPTMGVCGPNGTSKGVVTGSYTCLPGYYKSGFPEFCSRM